VQSLVKTVNSVVRVWNKWETDDEKGEVKFGWLK
jgi:hypothetical protein